ncbi:hypothetical protein KFK09_007746 [Dendrobium nobile]|uniref:Peptidase S8/S53 domain-containing protein n=1 Tax=Dendrobium nobile TaxID=94219 RepID=A0A8T3BSP9_DENNO|nr:hypothetical protein KFK09_007746 [Dendrobium nobile]
MIKENSLPMPTLSLSQRSEQPQQQQLEGTIDPQYTLQLPSPSWVRPNGADAPEVTAFSSRGPSLSAPGVIKPDVIAPGINILAAWSPYSNPSFIKGDDRRVVAFNILSSTSMSCPHVSGLAALLKSMHQNWSPTAIKSVLMTTAYTGYNWDFSILDISVEMLATPFAFGSGHVDPEGAAHPGFVYDTKPDDY